LKIRKGDAARSLRELSSPHAQATPLIERLTIEDLEESA